MTWHIKSLFMHTMAAKQPHDLPEDKKKLEVVVVASALDDM